jgi:pSer/pThr/pTyr-binding forkhead associated (FHA) protein
VSGVHARLEKKDGLLLVTDLDSTNGTFINEKRLKPGAVTPAPPGSYMTFGILAIIPINFLLLFLVLIQSLASLHYIVQTKVLLHHNYININKS